jgi:hypothetical protein
MNHSTEGSARGTGSLGATPGSSNESPRSFSSLDVLAMTDADIRQALNLGGAKKGTALALSTNKNKNLINVGNFTVEKLESLYLQQTNLNSKLPNSNLSKIIKEATEKYGL